ncbi:MULTISPECIES: hypothetical protein [Corynebacterium]|uniref:phage terminase small subunit n=1 Tax=Corynebacterium TaxID=1716 RepID=UPI000667A233|nr:MULTISPECIES: hypothetical protein [Corynebacterium]MDY7341389.1 hypothetical protein [Corynebacterium amycolatum]
MAGRGPAPKPANRRARKNKDPIGLKIVESDPVPQPELPKRMPNGEPWPQITRAWWRMWGRDPLAADFRATDWAELRDTAVIHGAYWSGDLKLAGELRLRTAKFGATAEDRARLRIQYAAADEADEKRRTSKAGADVRGVYKGLRAVD